MQLPEVLSSIAGGSITLAGFAAAFRAFSGTADPDGFSRVRLNSVIEGGLMIAIVCYVPAWLASLSVSADAVWRASSALILIWGVPRIIVPTTMILRRRGPRPEMFKTVVAFGAVALAAAFVNVIGAWPASGYSGHLLGVIALFANVGAIFIAQFRAERAS